MGHKSSLEEPIYSSSEDRTYNAVGVLPTVTTSELLSSYGATLLSSSWPKASRLFCIVTNKDLSVRPAPGGHSCCNCWRFLYRLALFMHSIVLFSSYFDGKNIPTLPLCKSRMEVSRAPIYCCCSSDCSFSISGQLLYRNWAVTTKAQTIIFLFYPFISPRL